MKKSLINILSILVIVIITFFVTRAHFPVTNEIVRTDTLRVDVPYEVERVVEKEVPVTVTEYRTDTVRIQSVRVERDTVYVTVPSKTLTYATQFLSNYPLAPKFLGLQFANHELELTYMETSGNTVAQTWNVQDGYRIGLNEGQPALETWEKSELQYYSEAGILKSFNSWSPYLEISGEYTILGLNVRATANINTNPFIKTGVKYEF